MLNKQTPLPFYPNEYLNVHSVFKTIQGEGPFAGRPAVFVRLHGCNLQCPHCDTEYTSESTIWSSANLENYIRKTFPGVRLVVITGGEPFRQRATKGFVKRLMKYEYYAQIETNGVFYPGDDYPWKKTRSVVVVSPKTPKIHPMTASLASCYKYVVDADYVEEDGLPTMALGLCFPGKILARPPEGYQGDIYLQPMDAYDETANQRNLQAVAKIVMNNSRYIMGVQMHKIIGLP